MQNRHALLVLTLLMGQLLQAAPESDIDVAKRIQAMLKVGDQKGVGHLVNYPVVRQRPLNQIANEAEFISNWDDFFDAEIIKKITGTEPREVGYNGVMLGDGEVWVSGGQITAINARTVRFEQKMKDVQKKDKAQLFATAQNYDQLNLDCVAGDHHIRIQTEKDTVKYFSWKKVSPLSTAPELVLEGKLKLEGSAGNERYVFKNKGFVYEVYHPYVCGEDCRTYLTVSQGKKTVFKKPCE